MVDRYIRVDLIIQYKRTYSVTGEMAKQLSRSSAKAVITQCSTYATVQAAIFANKVTEPIPIILVKDNVRVVL